jgi:hypothetical protein
LFLTYLGENGEDRATAVTTDASGNIYLTGWSTSVSPPFLQNPIPGGNVNAGGRDVVITKLTQFGTGIVYSTFLGGSGDDGGDFSLVASPGINVSGQGIAVDALPSSPGQPIRRPVVFRRRTRSRPSTAAAPPTRSSPRSVRREIPCCFPRSWAV